MMKASRRGEPCPDSTPHTIHFPFALCSVLWPLACVLGGPRKSVLSSGIPDKGRRKEQGPGMASPENCGRHIVWECGLWGPAGTWSSLSEISALGRCALTSPAWKAFQDDAI